MHFIIIVIIYYYYIYYYKNIALWSFDTTYL